MPIRRQDSGWVSRYPTLAQKTKTRLGWGTLRVVVGFASKKQMQEQPRILHYVQEDKSLGWGSCIPGPQMRGTGGTLVLWWVCIQKANARTTADKIHGFQGVRPDPAPHVAPIESDTPRQMSREFRLFVEKDK